MVVRRPNVNLSRTADALAGFVEDFLEVGDPAGHAADGEHDGEHLGGDAQARMMMPL